MTTALEDLLQQLIGLGLDAELKPAPKDGGNFTAYINVWSDPALRYPDATIWPPRNGYGWTWGAHHDHMAPDTMDAATLARKIKETLP